MHYMTVCLPSVKVYPFCKQQEMCTPMVEKTASSLDTTVCCVPEEKNIYKIKYPAVYL